MSSGLEKIVLDSGLHDAISVLFQQVAVEVEFERTEHWRAYCDVLYSTEEFRRAYIDLAVAAAEIKLTLPDFYDFYAIFFAELPIRIARLEKYSENAGIILKHLFLSSTVSLEATTTQVQKRTEKEVEIFNPEYLLSYVDAFIDFINKGDETMYDCLIEMTPLPPKTNVQRWFAGKMNAIGGALKKTTPAQRAQILAGLQDERLQSYDQRKQALADEIHEELQESLKERREARLEWIPRTIERFWLSEQLKGYEFHHVVGEGSGRIVHKARHEADESYVVVKIDKFDDSLESSNRRAQREKYKEERLAAREGHVARRLTHQHLVRYFDRGTLPDGRDYVIEEFVTGPTLKQVIYSEEETFEVSATGWVGEVYLGSFRHFKTLRQIASGIAYMHKRGYAHRDIKPENILINCFLGGEFEVKIGDLELAVLFPHAYLGDEEKKQDNTQPGSRRYAAPELLQQGILTQRADVFSYGIVAYELFEGEHPFGGEDAQQTATLICDKLAYRKIRRTIRKSKNIPPLLKPIIAKCLEYDPKKRYAHAGELLAELNAVNYQQHHPSFFAQILGWG